MSLTPFQERAVREDGRNILVAAGAGSGKTTVIAERVLAKIRRGVDVDRLVILTFTNAAAAEMRARIKAAIARDAALAPQMKKLDNAVIATFDSFTLRIVRENHHLLGLGNDLEIADQAALRTLEDRTLEATLAARYASGDAAFVAAVDRVWNGGDEPFAEALRLLAQGVRPLADADGYLACYETTFFSAEAVADYLSRFDRLLATRRDGLVAAAHAAAEALSRFRHPKAAPAADSYARLVSAFPDAAYAPFRAAVLACQAPRTPAKAKDVDEDLAASMRAATAPFRTALKRLKECFAGMFAATREQLAEAYLETRPVVMEVVSACRDYRVRLAAAKKASGLYGFDDVMMFAIDLIARHPDVRDRYRDTIAEIMVDEYQDTNDLQDRLVDLLQRDNVFMVGDVKQSIYGFRNANPANFMRRYREVARGANGLAIPLRENFRSRREVLGAVNALFETVMDEAVGGIDYRDGQALVFGQTDYDASPGVSVDHRPAVVAYDPGELPAVGVEAKIVAALVADHVARRTPVLDGKTYRSCRYGDFCILVDRRADFSVFQNALIAAGIPVYAVADEKFVASSEILFVLAMLRLVKCARDGEVAKAWFRHALYAAARSFVFTVPDGDVLPALADRALVDFTGLSGLPALAALGEIVSALAKVAPTVPADAFLADLYGRCDIYARAALLPDPATVEAKLDHLLEKAAALRTPGFDGLFDYIAGIAAARDLDIEFSRPLALDRDAVLLMTMHKAKGLEFPICIYPGLSKRFNRADTRGFFLFDKRFGLVTKAYDEGFKDTFMHPLFTAALDRDTIAERIRLFYVALTRAKEQMILLLNVAKDDGERPLPAADGYLPEAVRLRYASYADLVRSVRAADAWRVAPPAPVVAPATTTPETRACEPPELVRFDQKPVTIVPRPFAQRSPAAVAPDRREAMATGVRFHAILETFAFDDPERALAGLDGAWRKRVGAFLAHPELRGLDHAVVYRELEFLDGEGAAATRGVIDFLMLADGVATIVDYKLKHLDDPAYVRQLAGYRAYVEKTTGFPVRTYLYSILDDLLVETGGDIHA